MKGTKNQNRDLGLEAIVGNMLISQYQAHILKSRIADRLDKSWVLTQDIDRSSSSFTFNRERKEFKVSLRINEFMFGEKDRRRNKRK
jgi:hypothetical protein